MKIIINEQDYYDDSGILKGNCRSIFILTTKALKIRWFIDCGEWFCYIYLGKKWWRFSSVGFLRGDIKERK